MAENDDGARVAPADAAPPSFEQALARLERIVGQLEEGELGLAESLARYEEGAGLLRQCYGLLQRAERRVETLIAVDAQQQPVTEPFHDEPSANLPDKAHSRSRRRGSRPAAVEGAADDAGPSRPQEPRELF